MKEFLHNQYKNLFLWAPIFISFGAGIYFSLNSEPNIWVIVASFLCGILAFFRVKKYPALCLIACLLTGFGYSGIYAHCKNVPTIEHDTHGIQITGKITNIDYTEEKLRIYLNTSDYGKVRVSTTTDSFYNIGDTISGKGGLFKPQPAVVPNGFDFAQWAYFDNITATGYINDIQTLYTAESSVYNIRNRIRTITNSFLVDSLVLGYKNTMPHEHRQVWATNGVAHIWSISGYHITLVMGWLFVLFYLIFRMYPKLVRRVPARIPAIICAWGGLIGYVILSGGGIATLRAFLMATLVMLAFVFGRNVISLRMASIAFIVLFTINPHFITHAGFQLSFAAVFGILWLWTVLKPTMPSNKILRYIYASILTALVAGVFTCPFIMMHFGTIQLYGILGNLIFLPIFSFILMPLVVIGTCLAIFGFHAPISFAHTAYNHLFQIAIGISNIPMSEINLGHISNTAIIFIVLGLGCIIFIVNSEKFKYAILRNLNFVFGAAFICIGITIAATTPRPIFYISNNHKLIGAVIDGTLQFNKAKDSSNYFAFDTWKQYNGEPTQTPNPRLAKESGVYIVPFSDFSVAYIQNFVPLSNNISAICDNDNIKYIVSYFDIKTKSECSNKIIYGGGVIYKSGQFIPIPNNRLWHNRHE